MSPSTFEFSTLLVPLAVFGAFATIAWLVVDRIWGKKRFAEGRLDRMRKPRHSAEPEQTGMEKMSSAMSKVLSKATPQLAKPLQPKDAESAGRLRSRLSHAGFRSDSATSVFLGLKVLCLIGGFFLGGGAVLFSLGLNQAAILRTVLVTGIAFYLPEVVLFLITKSRHQAIFLALPDVIDLMVVCVEAGLGLDQAMSKVADEMKKVYPVVAQEFRIANMQLQMGVNRNQALSDLGERNGENELKSLTSVLVQAGKFGAGVGQALRVQSDSMRTRRRQIAEEKAAKTAVQLIFPLVLFIFPGIFVVLVGPAAVNIARNLLPSMGG
jgi:tight adherence protein C